eukprot:896439-Rhodomonas_salina.3
MVMMTHQDLAFAFAELSNLKFVQNPGQVHLKAVLSTLSYLAGTADKGVTYSRPALDKHVDSDYAADPDTCRSVTGYVVSLNNGPVSWRAKHQSCTTMSYAEAEFVAACM